MNYFGKCLIKLKDICGNVIYMNKDMTLLFSTPLPHPPTIKEPFDTMIRLRSNCLGAYSTVFGIVHIIYSE